MAISIPSYSFLISVLWLESARKATHINMSKAQLQKNVVMAISLLTGVIVSSQSCCLP